MVDHPRDERAAPGGTAPSEILSSVGDGPGHRATSSLPTNGVARGVIAEAGRRGRRWRGGLPLRREHRNLTQPGRDSRVGRPAGVKVETGAPRQTEQARVRRRNAPILRRVQNSGRGRHGLVAPSSAPPKPSKLRNPPHRCYTEREESAWCSGLHTELNPPSPLRNAVDGRVASAAPSHERLRVLLLHTARRICASPFDPWVEGAHRALP
jgi:hypothetical protein